MAINNVVLVGRMVRDAELRKTQSGVSVASFTVAVDRPYKSGEEKLCDFINCTAWRGTADFVGGYFHKGDMIGLTGEIQVRKWQTESGENRYATEVVARNVSFVGGKKSDSETAPAQTMQTNAAELKQQFTELTDPDLMGDLPF